jgi:hypothetical protein
MNHEYPTMPNETGKDTDTSSSEQSIGRPPQWREGRYEKEGTAKEQSVLRKPDEAPPDTTSTTVTERDYRQK